MMEYRIIGYIALGIIGAYIVLRIVGQLAFKKIIRTELETVLHDEKHKVKGKYG